MPLTAQQRFRHIVVAALVAGFIAGVLVTALQSVFIVPLIATAEEYEVAAEPASKHEHPAGWQPSNSIERLFYTGVSTTLLSIGYGFLLAALLSRSDRSGWRQGAILGATGFLAIQLAPAIGLPPQPPGVPEADLFARQSWWATTVLASVFGLAMLYDAYRRRRWLWGAIAAVVLALPHFVGAPQAPPESSTVPAELVHRFTWMALMTSASMWLVLGVTVGALLAHLRRRPL